MQTARTTTQSLEDAGSGNPAQGEVRVGLSASAMMTAAACDTEFRLAKSSIVSMGGDQAVVVPRDPVQLSKFFKNSPTLTGWESRASVHWTQKTREAACVDRGPAGTGCLKLGQICPGCGLTPFLTQWGAFQSFLCSELHFVRPTRPPGGLWPRERTPHGACGAHWSRSGCPRTGQGPRSPHREEPSATHPPHCNIL